MYLAANDINTKLLYDNKFQIDILESAFEEFPVSEAAAVHMYVLHVHYAYTLYFDRRRL